MTQRIKSVAATLIGCAVLFFGGLEEVKGQWTEPDSTQLDQPGPGAQAPWISNDNLRLYMSSPSELAVFTRASVDSGWGQYVILPDHINSTPTQRCPAESPMGDTLYFIGDLRTDCENYGSYDVYYTVLTDTGWGPVFNAGQSVSSDRREISVGISRDGTILLVSSMRLGTIEAEIFWHDKQQDGTWGPANHFGTEINDINTGEEHPCLSPDNNRLFYCRRGPMLNDIRVSERVDGVWQQSVALPTPPNNWPQLSVDEDPCLAIDGQTLWFRQANFDGFSYKLMVTVDTSRVSATEEPPVYDHVRPSMSATTDPSGSLRLIVTGIGFFGEHEVLIYDVLGRLVMSKEVAFVINDVNNSSVTLQQPNLTSGTYVISISYPTGQLSARFVYVR